MKSTGRHLSFSMPCLRVRASGVGFSSYPHPLLPEPKRPAKHAHCQPPSCGSGHGLRVRVCEKGTHVWWKMWHCLQLIQSLIWCDLIQNLAFLFPPPPHPQCLSQLTTRYLCLLWM
jgi:hypothetical protein